MADSSQQATQPFENPRKLGRHLSDVSEHDASDVICLLHPNSPAAFEAVKVTMLKGPQHILQNDDLEGIDEDDLYMNPELNGPREFALRMSSVVKSPKDGFRFGRNANVCDVTLVSDQHDKLVSNIHFKIFVNSQGSLMVQDMSTNGTIVDDDHLKCKDRQGRPMAKPATRALMNGSIICVVGGPSHSEIKLVVRIPNRGDSEDLYEEKLRKYLAARGKVAQFASMRESSFGNHWNGGATYNFTGLLGKGAFATVYRIQTKSEGELFAAKELDKRRFIKNGILDIKFDSELKIMKDLKHPNIVEYMDCQTHGHWIYIIMEYIPYGELSRELQERKYIAEEDVQQITRQTLHALDYLHRRKITHRDIKPDNILIKSREPFVVKLSDFGLSKCVTDQETFLKTFCGTLLYCAPEVYPDYANYTQGAGGKRRRVGEPAPRTSPYDQSVDMWSFGAVLFHLLCGKPPITGRGDDRGAQMLSNIMTKDVDFEPLRSHGVSEMAIHFVSLLLNRNPFLRPKETACFEHSWLRDVPDVCVYEKDIISPALRRDLDAVAEEGESFFDDEDLIEGLKQLTQHVPPSSEVTVSSSDRPFKRVRTLGNASIEFDDIKYPELPAVEEPQPPISAAAVGGRLFGEITPSVLRSSGVFGAADAGAGAGVGLQNTGQADVPGILDRVEQISVNDFVTFDNHSTHMDNNVSEHPRQDSQTLGIAPLRPGSASSLFGAEDQIGQLNMASPDIEQSNATTPETTHPITPRTREMSPSSSIAKSAVEEESVADNAIEVPEFDRTIDLDLLGDEEAFAASVRARDASRAEKLRLKAQTFHAPSASRRRVPSIELAATIDAQTGLEVQSQPTYRGLATPINTYPSDLVATKAVDIAGDQPLPASRTTSQHSFIRPLKRIGKLTTVPGSFKTININLEDRMTSWGRDLDCTIRYADKQDTRVPKLAMRVIFWAPNIEKWIEEGNNWTECPGVQTIVSTGTRQCIWINDVELRKELSDGSAALYGKIYTGDIITIFKCKPGGDFMQFRVEITFGDSARPRPEEETGFQVKKEYHHHQRYKERESLRMSLRMSGKENELQTTE